MKLDKRACRHAANVPLHISLNAGVLYTDRVKYLVTAAVKLLGGHRVLDEITANLDAETEARVLEALRRASEGRTVLSVSHRIYESLGGRTVEIKML